MSVQAGSGTFDGRPVDRKLLEDLQRVLEYRASRRILHVDGSVALLYRPFHTTAESRRGKATVLLAPRLSSSPGMDASTTATNSSPNCVANSKPTLPMSLSSQPLRSLGHRLLSAASSATGPSPYGSLNSMNYSSPLTTWPSGTSFTTSDADRFGGRRISVRWCYFRAIDSTSTTTTSQDTSLAIPTRI